MPARRSHRQERERERAKKKIYGILGTFRYVELSPLLTELPPKPHKHWEALRAEGTRKPLRPEGRRERERERKKNLVFGVGALGDDHLYPCTAEPARAEPSTDLSKTLHRTAGARTREEGGGQPSFPSVLVRVCVCVEIERERERETERKKNREVLAL